MTRRNHKIREMLKKCNMNQWELAIHMNISEYTLCKKLRVELPKEEQERIIALIKEKAGEQ